MSRTISVEDIPRLSAIPTPSARPEDLLAAVQALKSAVEVLSRQTRTVADSAVRLRELERLGLITLYKDGTVYSDILSRIEALE